MFYITTILGAAMMIALANFFAGGIFTAAALAYYVAVVLLGVVAVIAVDGVLAFVARRMPERWFSPEAKLFTVGEREKKLYKKMGIESWKKYIPELGCFTGFHKDKMRDPRKSEYVARFLLESNYGVLGHVLGAFLGFLIMLLPFLNPLSMALPIAIVNFVLSTLPTMILRYNTPALRRLYRRNLEREEREANASKGDEK